MAIHKKAKIKRMKPTGVPKTVEEKTKIVGENAGGSSNPLVSAKGTAANDKADELKDAISDNKNKHNAAVLATKTMLKETKLTAKAYNNLATICEIELPDNVETWIEMGFEVTKTIISEVGKPGKVLHGAVTQGDFSATADIHHDPVAGARDYSIRVTKGDLGDDASYIMITKPRALFTKSNATVKLPDDYLNVPLWWKVTAHNTAGSGPESDPFGGRRIS